MYSTFLPDGGRRETEGGRFENKCFRNPLSKEKDPDLESFQQALFLPDSVYNHLHGHFDLFFIIPVGFRKEEVPNDEQTEDAGS